MNRQSRDCANNLKISGSDIIVTNAQKVPRILGTFCCPVPRGTGGLKLNSGNKYLIAWDGTYGRKESKGKIEITIDVDHLRNEDLGACFGGGFGGALMEAFDIDKATPQELVRIAQEKGF